MSLVEDLESYPEHPLRGRTKLAYDWIPGRVRNLLDGGCAWGYSTRYFDLKSRQTFGIDSNDRYITVAKHRYPHIHFTAGRLENTAFESRFFDVVILNDILEHVENESYTLAEVFRILRPGGTCIITAPHRGLFSFLDVNNYGYHLRRYIPSLYLGYKRRRGGGSGAHSCAGSSLMHRHYSRYDIINMLQASAFRNSFEIERIFRSGLFLSAFTRNTEYALTPFLGKKWTSVLIQPLEVLAGIDYCIPYGMFSYCIAVEIMKK